VPKKGGGGGEGVRRSILHALEGKGKEALFYLYISVGVVLWREVSVMNLSSLYQNDEEKWTLVFSSQKRKAPFAFCKLWETKKEKKEINSFPPLI